MDDYDRLPPELRQWVAGAMLPWRARSVKQAFDKALKQTGDRTRALQELDDLQKRLVARDGPAVWGECYPAKGG